jgi:hypothetical protein
MNKFIITEEEKSRILEMHETATNRYYLNEDTLITEAEWYNAIGSVIGIFDPTGLVDFVNGISYLSQGDMFFGLLSMISVVPYIGDVVAKPLMLAGKGSQVVKNTNSALQFAKSGDVTKASGLLAKVGSTNSLLGKFISSVAQWSGKLKQMIQKTPASKMSNGLKTILNNIVLSFEKAATKLKSIVVKPKPTTKTLVPVTAGIKKNKQLVNLELSKNKGKFNLQRTAQKSAKKVWDYKKRKINDTLEFIGRPKGGGVADVKNIKNPDEYVSLKLGRDQSGDFYYMSAKMSNPRDAGVAFKELKKAIPKGARFGEPAKGSLSTDSFYSMLRRTKEFTPKIVNYIKLNGVGTKRFQQFIKNNVEHNTYPNILKFKNSNDAKLLSTEINKEIQKNNIQTLSKIKKNEEGLWEVLIPNIQLIMP